MSHEIRTPLNGVLGNVNLLLEENLPSNQKALAQDAKLSGQNLLELLNDILDFSKIDAGFMKLEVTPVNVRNLSETVERSYHRALTEKGLTCEVKIDDRVPVMIMGDALRLRQVMNNLFSNAIKFTASGSVNLSVSLDSAGESIRFSVKDSGIGIPADKVGSLFSPFTQAESSTTRRFGGTGLGLSICRELAHLMGGEVEVESQIGKGSEFTLRVPLVVADQEVKSRGPEEVAAAVVSVGIEPISVLLVEDNLVNRTLMTKLLAKYGHTVDVAVNGLEAVEMVGSTNYDLIFMDCQMPVMDGFEATRKIRENPGTTRPHIVALTANAFKEDQDKCYEAGMDDFVTKPVSRESLEKIMRSAKKRNA
jgi:CheY-like chemotaxis protein